MNWILLLFVMLTALPGRTEIPPVFATPPSGYQLQKNYNRVDPTHLINPVFLEQALKYFEVNSAKIKNQNYLTLIDFSQHASQRRLYVIDLTSGQVNAMLTSVGHNSDPDGNGYADSFSNVAESNQSSLGFYLTDDEYMGGNGRSLRLHGLSSTNSNALSRFIVVHGAPYVSEADNYAGRSQGCPAVDLKNRDWLIDRIKSGSLIYAFFH